MNQIDELLTKYFEGETSAAEERQLRAFFRSGEVPERLAAYKPLFAYFDAEIQAKTVPKPARHRWRPLYLSLSGIAACLLLAFCLHSFLSKPEACTCSGDYVLINGKCYTDKAKVRASAFAAMREVATPVDDYIFKEE
ncbi:MAG: hypothetical protein LBL81_00580 [Tannerella sp.]|jgi:hypothetical protein|nr:hypothetical protein [Tannerella sp.]